MIYTINKGSHSCLHLPNIHFGIKSVMFNFKFTESCNYNLDNVDNYDINKLFGVSWGHHHTNSFRIGWNRTNSYNYFDLYTYSYNNKVRRSKKLLTVNVNDNILGIFVPNYKDNNISGYIVTKDKFSDINEGFIFPKFKWGYKLFPYFGGNQVSPHKMKIELEQL